MKFPVEATINGKSILYNTSFREGYDVILPNNDVLDFLKSMPDRVATLIVTSPRYNIGKPYEQIYISFLLL